MRRGHPESEIKELGESWDETETLLEQKDLIPVPLCRPQELHKRKTQFLLGQRSPWLAEQRE